MLEENRTSYLLLRERHAAGLSGDRRLPMRRLELLLCRGRPYARLRPLRRRRHELLRFGPTVRLPMRRVRCVRLAAAWRAWLLGRWLSCRVVE